MQALKVIVPGQFWDSQIYEGRLYLFHRDGEIRTIDWDRLIDSWSIKRSLRLALKCGFARSDYLYGSNWQLFFSDPEVKTLVLKKFSLLAKETLHVLRRQFEETTLRVQSNPFPFPHTDSTIYHRTMFVASQAGVFAAECKRRRKHPIDTNATKRWDAPVVKLSANYNNLALAALDEGLFELPIGEYSPVNEPTRLTTRHCSTCGWAYYSIFGSSRLDGGFLAQFRKVKDSGDPTWGHREREKVLSDRDIFHDHGFSWATNDKLCLAVNGSIRTVRYQPWLKRPSGSKDRENTNDRSVFTQLKDISLPRGTGTVLSGAVALFGTVLELGDKLFVLRSDNQIDNVARDFVTWRVFPRAKHYENQLHVIYDDRLEMLSFNHDYFLDQRNKVSGFTHFEPRPFGRNF